MLFASKIPPRPTEIDACASLAGKAFHSSMMRFRLFQLRCVMSGFVDGRCDACSTACHAAQRA
jgi:hypothetical protein